MTYLPYIQGYIDKVDRILSKQHIVNKPTPTTRAIRSKALVYTASRVYIRQSCRHVSPSNLGWIHDLDIAKLLVKKK